MSGRPKECLHCGYLNWAQYMGGYPKDCERCERPLGTKPEPEEYETVLINGRHVQRKRND